MPYVVGLTGGIGNGKTVVSDRFAELGVPVIDTDLIARMVVEPGQPALSELVAAFGSQILLNNGRLDRSALRQIAFSDDAKKAQLDSITHPAIGKETIRQLQQVSYPYCILVVPLLGPESQLKDQMNRVLVVTADRQARLARVKKRSKLSAEEVKKIMRTQLDDDQRLEFADDVIPNNGSISEAHAQVDDLHEEYLKLSLAD